MSTITSPISKDQKTDPSHTKKVAENHLKAAQHHQEAAKHHEDAAKHTTDGNHEKANVSTIKAHGEHYLANEAHKEVVKQHVVKH